MYIIYGCHRCGITDENFLQDDADNLANICGVFFFEQFEYESMKTYLIQKTAGLHRCRSKLVKIFGFWWYQDMSAEEWEKKKDAVVILEENVHTD